MLREIIGDGPPREVKRYEPSRATQTKTIKTKLIRCTDCLNVVTVDAKPSLISRVLNLDCQNCKKVRAARKAEEAKEAQRLKLLEQEQSKRQRRADKFTRHCPDCGGTWTTTTPRGKTKAGNRCPACRDLHRAQRVRCCTYGLDSHSLEALIEASGSRCMNLGCDRPLVRSLMEADGDKFDVMCIDHDHETGLVRGILCHECNFALGHLGDSLDRIIGLAAYVADQKPPIDTVET